MVESDILSVLNFPFSSRLFTSIKLYLHLFGKNFLFFEPLAKIFIVIPVSPPLRDKPQSKSSSKKLVSGFCRDKALTPACGPGLDPGFTGVTEFVRYASGSLEKNN